MSHMLELTKNQHYAAFELLVVNGWVWLPEKDKEGFMAIDSRGNLKGWLVHPEKHPHRMGDPKPMGYATRVTMSLYTNFTKDDLPTLSYDMCKWIWPDGQIT